MKKLTKQLFVGFSFLFAMLLTNFVVAQQSITLEWSPGGFVGEVGYEIIQSSTGAVVACEQTGGAGPTTQTVLLADDETYEVRGFDSWGDGWNGGVLTPTIAGVSLGSFAMPSTGGLGTGTTNTCNGAASGGLSLGTFFVAAPCDISCPADITVDNDPGVCGADVDVPAATVGSSCEGAFQFANASTGQVPFNFNFTGIIQTFGDLPGAVSVIGDVELAIEVVGDFGAGFELFQLRGPDGSIVISQGAATPGDCNQGSFDVSVAQSTWNNWVATYGSTLEFYTVADPDVDNICASSYWQIDAAQPTASLPFVNDYNNTDDASDFYGVGETVVTFTTFSGGFPSTCETTITVVDAEAPTFDPCPADMVFNLDPGLCGTIISYEVDAFDNCPPSSNFYQIGNPTITQAINCNNWGAGITNLNYHYRTFAYPGASNENFDGINVAIGQDPGGFDLIVRVYELDGSFPGGTLTLLAEGSAGSTPGGNNYFLDVAFASSVQVSAGASLLLEVETPQSNSGAFGLGYGPGNDPTWLQSTPCGASSPTPTGALGLSTGLIFGVNTSNPPVAIVRLDAVPYDSGDEWPIGVYNISYEATDAVGNASQCNFNITVNEYANPTATLACNDDVEIALPASGSTEVGADMILEGGPYGCYDDYEVEVDGNGNTVDCDDVGSTLSVLVTDPDTGNSCFGHITIVDNIDPEIECTDFAITCTYDIGDLEEGTVLSNTANLAKGPQPSYDNSSVDFEFELNAGPSALVEDLTVDLDISHTWVSDLAVTLTSPSGTSATLFAGACGLSDDILATFTDAGAPLACGGTPVIAGDVQPSSPFAAFAGEAASGTWVLTIADNFGADPTNINALGLNITYASSYVGPVVTEACDYDVTMESVEAAGDCDGDAGTIFRQYTVTDASGNTASCFETITIIRPTLSDVAVPPSYDGMEADMLDCSGDGWDTNGNGYPDVEETGGPTIDGQPFENGSSCNISSTYEDVVIDICAGSYKVRREWLVIDWCTGEEVEYNQLIKIMDTTGPDVNEPSDAITIEVTAGGADCTGDIAIAPLLVNGDDCAGTDESTYETEIWTTDFVLLETVAGNGGVFSGYDLTSTNPANNNNAQYFIRHTFDDNCGNETQVLYLITVVDKVAPTAVCDEITDVALNSAGEAVVFAETFDDGSYDNCGDVYVYAARMPFAGYPMAALNFYDAVTFDCADVDGSHMVVMLVLDFEPEDFYFLTDANGDQYLGGYNLSTPAFDGSWNACMVEVEVEDKLAPYLAVPGNLEISCEEYYADVAAELDNGNGDILDDMFGTAVFGDNCEALDDYSYTYGVDQCGIGSITRSWTVNDPSGNGPVSGTQTISIYHVSNWSISFPGDLDATCVDGELPDFGQPTISGDDCEMIAVSHTDTQYDVVPDACYKIVREWSAINWCTYPDETAVTATQVIKVTDNEAPIFDVEDFTVQITEADCDAAVTLPTPDVTDCSDDITISTSSDLPAGEAGPGTYTATYTVSDGCGNYSYDVITITVVDAKKPTPYLTDELVTEIMQTGMTQAINVNDFDIGSFDNCSGVVLSFSPDVNDTERTFTCDEIGNNTLEVWVTDEAGNQDFATVTMTVQDNMGVCAPEQLAVAGALATQNDEGIEDAVIDINGGLFNQVTDATGSFDFNLDAGGDYSVVPSLDAEADNGVTTYDIVLVTRHILGIAPFTSPYQMIAADANNTNTVTTLDAVAIRKVILQIDDSFPNNTSWRFVDADHVFTDALNPWGFPEVVNINNLADAQIDVDFTGVKVGDVNGSAQANFMSPAENRTDRSIQINADNELVKAGQDVTVTFTSDAQVSGYQFTLNHEGLELISINEGLAKAENFGIMSGAITASWNDMEIRNLSGDELFSVTFKANADVQLSDVLSINSRYTAAEAYTTQGIESVELSFNGKAGASFALYQNEPNPFKGATTIGFEMANAGKATLSIMSVSGQTLRVVDGNYGAGYNEVIVKDLNATGVLYYTLEADGFTATKKMIIIE